MAIMTTLFPTGLVVQSEPAQVILNRLGLRYIDFLARHASCDWGDVDQQHEARSYAALTHGWDVSSFYDLKRPKTRLVITTTGARDLTRIAVEVDGVIK